MSVVRVRALRACACDVSGFPLATAWGQALCAWVFDTPCRWKKTQNQNLKHAHRHKHMHQIALESATGELVLAFTS